MARRTQLRFGRFLPTSSSAIDKIDCQAPTLHLQSQSMPTVLRIGPYRFFFYAGDRDEPPHVHVERDHQEAKFWLAPPRLERDGGFTRKELSRIERIIDGHQDELMRKWNEFFDQGLAWSARGE